MSNSYADKLTFPHLNSQIWKELCHLVQLPTKYNNHLLTISFGIKSPSDWKAFTPNYCYIKISSWSMPLIKRKLINEFSVPLKSLKNSVYIILISPENTGVKRKWHIYLSLGISIALAVHVLIYWIRPWSTLQSFRVCLRHKNQPIKRHK